MISKIIANCSVCDKDFDIDEIYMNCQSCDDGIRIESVKDCLKEQNSKSYRWEDREHYCGFDSEEEKTIYLQGLKEGHELALFWVAEYFGLVKFFEELYLK